MADSGAPSSAQLFVTTAASLDWAHLHDKIAMLEPSRSPESIPGASCQNKVRTWTKTDAPQLCGFRTQEHLTGKFTRDLV